MTKSHKKRKRSESIERTPMRTSSSKDPELAGCASPELRPAENEYLPALNSTISPSFALKNISPNDLSSVRTFGSDEISDQDVRCKWEMEKMADQLRENINLADVSGYTIEPSSSKSQAEQEDDDNEIDVHDNSKTVFTLSVNENSCNAVDVPTPVSAATEEKPLPNDLSFNGKIGDTSSGLPKGNEIEKQPNDSSRLSREILQLETSREKINERSPDLFSDEDVDTALDDDEEPEYEETAIEDTSAATIDDKNDWEQKERNLRKNIQNQLSGILPPPSVTYCHHDIAAMLILYKTNVDAMQVPSTYQEDSETLDENFNFKPKEIIDMQWPEITNSSAKGIHYNRTKHSDHIEILFMKLAERNIGSETSSSFSYNEAPNAKKKTVRKM